RIGAAEGLEIAAGVAAHREAQRRRGLLWRRVGEQIGANHVVLRALGAFEGAGKLGAVARIVGGCDSGEAERHAAAGFAILPFDAAPALAAGHEIVGGAAAGFAAISAAGARGDAPASRELGRRDLHFGGSGARRGYRHDAAESGG